MTIIYGGFQAVSDYSGTMPTGATQDFIVCAQAPATGATSAAVLNSYFCGDVVKQTIIQPSSSSGTLASGGLSLLTATGSGTLSGPVYVTGVVESVKYYDSSNRFQTNKFITAGTMIGSGTALLPNQIAPLPSTALAAFNGGYFFMVTVNINPTQVYSAFYATSGSGVGLLPNKIGSPVGVIVNAGNPATGLSGYTLDGINTLNSSTSTSAPFRIAGISNQASNQYGAGYQGNGATVQAGNFVLVTVNQTAFTPAFAVSNT